MDSIPGGFSFNQYLIVDDEPLLFHTGPRKMFPLVREAVERVLPVERLRYVALSHFEADECGSLNEWLAVAPAGRAAVRPGRGDGVGRRLSPTGRRARWPTASELALGRTSVHGSTRRICRTAGNAAS